MGLPFDWHLRPRRITHLRSKTAQQAPKGAQLSLGKLSLLRPSMQTFKNSLRRFSMHPVGCHSARVIFCVWPCGGLCRS